MGPKRNRQQWYEHHKNKAAESAIQSFASAEKSALDAVDAKIADLDRERKSLEATQSGWSGLLATGLRQLRAQVVDLIGLGVKTCPYKRLICWV
jgi:hypothetical protein